ncbi:MAG: ribonuclease III [Clostridia bacterium]|nr:ribonuclease III [Clostridia bacterium]
MNREISSHELAYLGDAVLEVLVREHLVRDGSGGENASEAALGYVTAAAQSDAFSAVEDKLTDEELDVYRRARNNYHTSNVPKSASAVQYRRSTGFEAVFGYLYLAGREERLRELFRASFGLKQ